MKKKLFCLLIAVLVVSCVCAPCLAANTSFFDSLDEESFTRDFSAFGGASSIAVVENGELVFSHTAGALDVASGAAANEDSVFMLGRISGLFVWISVMQLYESGELALDVNIEEYLPANYLSLTYPVTMDDLMTNSAGFEDYLRYDEFVHADSDEEFTRKHNLYDIVGQVQPAQLFEPGSVRTSSFYETSLAAVIVEQVSGMSYVDYVNANILEPLGMEFTSVASYAMDKPHLRDNMATSYYFAMNGYTVLTQPRMYSTLYPSYGAYSTALDMARLAIAITGRSEVLFSDAETYDRMQEIVYSIGDDVFQSARGLLVLPGASTVYGVDADFAYGKGEFSFSADGTQAMIVLSNEGASYTCAIANLAHTKLYGEKVLPEVPDSSSDLPLTIEFIGEYMAVDEICFGAKSFAECMRGTSTIVLMQSNPTVRRSLYMYSNHYDINRAIVAISHFDEILQVAPNRFSAKTTGTSDELYVVVEDGVVTKVFFDNREYVPMPWYRSVDISNASIVVSYLLLAFCIGAVAFVVVFAIKNRLALLPTLGTSKLIVPLVMVLTALILNNAIFLIFTYGVAYSQYTIHFILNYILAFAAVGIVVTMLILWRKSELFTYQKVGYSATIGVTLFTVLYTVLWNLYS
ncbi:MAG: serine hydrolase domain-containing protein [Clostridia bacterium]|nr:serine hydrolase domain-containing protein [Clostridia bacterium]